MTKARNNLARKDKVPRRHARAKMLGRRLRAQESES